MNDQLEREVEATLARLATRAVPDSARRPAPPWQEPSVRRVDARRFGRATPWLIAAVLLIIVGLGVGAAVTFDASAPDRSPVGTEVPSPTVSSTGTDAAPVSTPSTHPSLARPSNGAGPDESTASGASDIAVYANCNDPSADAPAVRPTSIGLACADNGLNLVDLRWSTWSADGASGVGTLRYRTCDPDCATGSQLHDVPGVALTLSAPVTGADHVLVWTLVTVTPDPVGTGTYPLQTTR